MRKKNMYTLYDTHLEVTRCKLFYQESLDVQKSHQCVRKKRNFLIWWTKKKFPSFIIRL